jgi:hypothetical protein
MLKKGVILAATCLASTAAAQTPDIIRWCNYYNRNNPSAAARCIQQQPYARPAAIPFGQSIRRRARPALSIARGARGFSSTSRSKPGEVKCPACGQVMNRKADIRINNNVNA